MFGKNEIVGKKFFNISTEAQDGKLLVTSMFMTLQGEGPYRGEPAFFIRLAKCNLACSFCDTYFDQGEWLSLDEILTKIDQKIEDYFEGNVPRWASFLPGYETDAIPIDRGYAKFDESYWVQNKRRSMALVVTGGEPSLQENLLQLLVIAGGMFKKTQIESNGLFMPPVIDSTTVVISPKCSEKMGVATKYLKPSDEVLERADCLKFVMEAPREDTSTPYSTIPDWAHAWADNHPNRQVFVSPMNIYNREPQRAKEQRATNKETTIEQRSDSEEVISFWEKGLLDIAANKRNHEHTARYAIKHGFIFSMQQHLFASVA